jgi:hypothetical protein
MAAGGQRGWAARERRGWGWATGAEQGVAQAGQQGAASGGGLQRPAFYALRPGGWRDLLTLLHPPYTAWHLSYVAIGAAVAPRLHLDRLGWTLGAFFLGVGVCAHALDELHGRPLATRLSGRTLWGLAVGALTGAVAIGVMGAVSVSASIWPLTVLGAFIVVAYNLELFGGRFHSDLWFAAAWGAFPALVGFWANAEEARLEGLLAMGACFMLSVAQRRLSTPARELRRRTASVSGEQRLSDGRTVQLDAARLAAPLDAALGACALGMVLLAAGMVIARL